ncbi:serine/threonine-protein kinase [Blastococcus sp. TF02A-30]|uniref:serine/threonine-protein kinase n=1 Tax=Blastococcus sp. TF02A-30 TaxID=2250580 RepID=UPI000DEAA032|nr:serine/threonine-protein kinase [Blastococcus sp. TF02A-30]RBY84577.1 serine/threonine protein kinase [Blastococcus sp. TF02A-30]
MTRPVTAPGRLVAGRYRLRSQIGGGGMGAVWLARDERLGREVAVKQVLTSATDPVLAEEQRQRALREGRIAARLSHRHAIAVYDVALEEGTPWLVMEYLPSRSLAEVLGQDGVLRVDQVAQIGAQVADALAATHAAGIVHRDVKPANILIGRGERVEGLVKITDFGISHASGDVTLTQTGQITGTPAFLAPEVAQGREMTHASDVFSLGATLYTCLEGQPPFGMEDNALGMLHKVAGGQIRPPLRAGSLAAPLQRMLAADPAERPSMADVRDELARLAAGRDGDTTTVLLARTDVSSAPQRPRTEVFAAPPAATPSPPPTAPPAATPSPRPAAPPPTTPPPAAVPAPRRRRRGAWLAAGLLTAAVAALVLFLFLRPDGSGDPGTEAQETAPTTSAETTAEQQPDAPADEAPADDAPADDAPADTGQPDDGEPQGGEPAGDPATAVTEFFALVPGDLEAAYELTSPGFQENFPFGNFAGFWGGFSRVQVSGIEADGDDRALADITYVRPDGSSTTERHELRFVRGDDGRLLLERDEIA